MLFKVWLNVVRKEMLSEINVMAFSDESSLIKNFMQVRERNNYCTSKMQSIRSSADLIARSMILYL